MFCGMCGYQNPPEAGYCGRCGARLETAPYYPPPPPPVVVPPPAPAVAGPAPAGLGARVLAVALDTVILAAIFAVAGMWMARRLGSGATESGFSFQGKPALMVMGATLAAGFVYLWLTEAIFGATLGKALVGIRVRRKDGRACGAGPALVRNLMRVIDGLGVYLVGFVAALASKSRQRLGDMAAGTVVVEGGVGGAARVALAVLWVVLIGAGVTGAYLLHRGLPAETASNPAGVSLKSTGRLKIANFGFRQSKGGPARPEGPYKPGDTLFASYNAVSFSRDDEGRPRLALEVAAFDPNGLAIHEPWKGEFTGRVERGAPVDGNFKLDMPDFVTAGMCRLGVKVRDEISKEEAELTAPFRVEAETIPPAAGLEVRGFQLSLARDGAPTEEPVLEGAGTVYMRCFVHGLEFRGDEVDLLMTLRVVDPEGKTVLEEKEFASVRDSYVYHPPSFRVLVRGHVSVPSGMAKGVYREVYEVIDRVGGKTLTQEGRFLVR
jgi:uncharacterized RDD family membrane protein YckC